ncbi:hypothetical protein [Streptomyces adelaidensis]|uniref:hypothetical protein n=1 Tax=Streptomyces adelaidensis TaxID=2796465 RepID=UPI0019032F8E|nr:hypothetical protein [Streptomyces adelaidensis]
MSESAQIAAVLIVLAVLTPVLVTLRHMGVPSYPADASYAGFHDDPARVLLDCEGHCPGTTAHEITGDEVATCVLCGTHRSTLPDFAQADDEA